MGLLTRALTRGASGGAEGEGGGDILGGVMGKLMKKKKPKAGGTDETGYSPSGEPFSFKRGGKVRKTGLAKVHKGEVVLTKRQAKSHRKSRGK